MYPTGADFSAWNTVTDWNAVKNDPQNIRFAFIKATEGTGYKANYKPQWDGAGSIGLLRANYHYLRGAVTGANQAMAFTSCATFGELPPVADFEDLDGLKAQGGKAMFENLRCFLANLEASWNVTPIVYTGLWYLQLCWNSTPTYDSKWLAQYPLWVADYTASPKDQPLRPSWWPWSFRQFTSSGTLAGVTGRVDLNIFNGTEDQLRAFAHQPPLPHVLTDAEKLFLLWEAHPELHQ